MGHKVSENKFFDLLLELRTTSMYLREGSVCEEHDHTNRANRMAATGTPKAFP